MGLAPDKSTFLSVLDWLSQPGQAVMQGLRGNSSAALRHLGDFALDPIDAFLPGDVIQQLSRPEDHITGSEFAGVDRATHPFLATLADVGVGAALDPLTYLSFGTNQGVKLAGQTIAAAGKTVDPLTLIGNAARAGIDRLPGSVARPINSSIQGLKETLGYLNPDAAVADLSARADSLAGRVGRAKQAELESILTGASEDDLKRAYYLANNVGKNRHGIVGQLDAEDSSLRYGSWADQEALLQRRAASLPATPEETARALDLARKGLRHERTNFAEAIEDFPAFEMRPGLTSDIATKEINAPLDYLKRDYDFETSAPRGGASSPTSARTDKTTQQFIEMLTNGREGSTLDDNLGSALAARSTDQAHMAKQALVGKELIERGARGELGQDVQGAVLNVLDRYQRNGNPLEGERFGALADTRSVSAVNDVIEELGRYSPDNARVLRTAWAGLKPRGPITGALASLNRLFKPAAVYGLGWPGKTASTLRNVFAFPGQAAAEESLGWGQAAKQLLRTPGNIGHALGTSFDHAFGTSFTRGAVKDDAELMDKAFAQAGGRQAKALQTLHDMGRDDLVGALTHGVLGDGFVGREVMERPIRDSRLVAKGLDKLGASQATKDRVYNWLEAPGEGFQAAEDYARSNTFFDKRGELGDAGAAAAQRGAFYDYNTYSESNRALRDVVPFAAFTTNAIRQNAKFLSRTPGVGTALAGLYGQDDDEPLYPYLQEQAHVRLGPDEKGNPQYAAGLGLPIEALNLIPNLTGTSTLRGAGREMERIIGGSAQPLAKSGYAWLAGHDPYFETPFGSYDKLPGNIHAGAAGRAYNLAMNTGLLQPLETPLNIAGKILDDRRGPGSKALDLLTGANVVSVDPDLAMQQQLTKALENDPTVSQSRSLYVKPGDADDDTTALLKELARMKAAARKERASR